MIDLNQELEDFDAYFFKRHGELPLDPTSEEYANKSYLKHEMFKAWKKAKAQAVPDTHVVVPKDVAERTIGHIGIAMCHPNNTHDDENIMNDDQQAICKAVEASESGAEK
ncbi:hypothetical protein ACT4VJ_16135 [Acinetobacter baumannii]